MSVPTPPHYRAFRLALVVVLLLAVPGAVWLAAETGALALLLAALGTNR